MVVHPGPPAFCGGCGRPEPDCHGRCLRPLDPARYCLTCGARLVVQVFPNHVTTRCPAGQDKSTESLSGGEERVVR